MKLLFLAFILSANVYAYVDMSDTFNRAKDLNMKEGDYANAMALSGAFTGLMFGVFLWKAK